MDTLESLQRKIASADKLESVVKTMKAMAASNISQYETATKALRDYYNTIELGMMAYVKQKNNHFQAQEDSRSINKSIGVLVFGSDQGLVGQFNDVLSLFAGTLLNKFSVKKEIWAVGERMKDRLSDSGFTNPKLFPVPNSVSEITSLVENILMNIQAEHEKEKINEFYIFHNRLKVGRGYEPFSFRLLPLDSTWMQDLKKRKWPTNKLPQMVGGMKSTLSALIKEYLFGSIYRACAESLASENASRLEAMQRAEKNIDELQDELSAKYHQLRQSSIDEELFDVISGFEALKKDK